MEAIAVKSRRINTDMFIMLGIYFGVLAVHILLQQCATIFNLTPDEYSVSAIAAYVNGLDWSSTVSKGGYYGYLQGLLYAPVFVITDDPYLRYDLMLAINSVLVSFAPVITYYLGRRAFGINKGAAVLFALISGLYPSYMLLTKFTWNETLCDIIPWVFLLLVYKALSSDGAKKQALSVLGGLVLVAGYAAHGRMLALLAGGIALALIVHFAMKRKIFCFIGFFSGIGAALAADIVVKRVFQNALWLIEETGSSPANTLENTLSRIFSAGGEIISSFFKTLIGHLFYFLTSTWGFGAVCMVVIISVLWKYFKALIKKKKTAIAEKTEHLSDNEAILSLFVLLVMVAVFAVSAAFKCTSPHLEARCDTLIYGRYTEVFYPVAIFAALVLIRRGCFTLFHSLAALCSAAVINVLTVAFVVPSVISGTRMTSAMIMGLAPLRYGEKMKSLPTEQSFIKMIATTMIILMALLLIQFIIKKSRRVYLLYSFTLAAGLLYTNAYCYNNYNVTQSKNALVGAERMEQALSMVQGSGLYTVCFYDLASERYIKGQFILPEGEIALADSFSDLAELAERPHFMVADREDNLHAWIDGVSLVGSINNNMQLYACTDEAREWAHSQGYSLKGNGTLSYSGAELTASKTASLDEGRAICPTGSSAYTNYLTLYDAGTYRITVTGEGTDLGHTMITLTANEGEHTLDYIITEQRSGVLVIEFTAEQKLEGVRFELSNSNTKALVIESLVIQREDTSLYPLAQAQQ